MGLLVSLSLSLSVSLSVSFSVCLSVCLSVSVSVSFSVSLSDCLCLCLSLCVSFSVCLSVCLSLFLLLSFSPHSQLSSWPYIPIYPSSGSGNADDVDLHVLGGRVDILGTNCNQCVSTVQRCFTSTETVRFIRTESPGRPPRLSHTS